MNATRAVVSKVRIADGRFVEVGDNASAASALRATARQPSPGLPGRSSRFGVAVRERRLVRKKGLEPSRYCYRQPLKTIRLGRTPN
jgi:hypothetical protein